MAQTTQTSNHPDYDRWEELRTAPVWTPKVRAFVKKADLVVFYFGAVRDAPSWRSDAAFVEAKFVKQASGRTPEQTMTVKFAGLIKAGQMDLKAPAGYGLHRYSNLSDNLYRPSYGSWLVYLYPSQNTHAYSCLMALPTNSALTLSVRLDMGSNSYMVEHSLHCDILTLDAQKEKNYQTFDLDQMCTPHNTARFGFRT